MRISFTCYGALAILGQIAIAQEPAKQSEGTPGTRLTFEKSKTQSTPIITVKFSDKVSAKMILDTGSENCWMSDNLAKHLGLEKKPWPSDNVRPNAKSKTREYVEDVRFHLGPIPVETAFFILDAKRTIQVMQDDLEGIIGANLLEVMPIMIDFSLSIIDVYVKSPLTDADLKRLGMDGVYTESVPLQSDGGRTCPRVAVRLNDAVDVPLMIDTGAGRTFIPLETAKKLKLGLLTDSFDSMGFSGKFRSYKASMQRVAIGKMSTTNIDIGVRDKTLTGEHGILGLDVLARYRMVIDVPAKKLYLLEMVRNNVPVR